MLLLAQTHQLHRSQHQVKGFPVDGGRELTLPLPWDSKSLEIALDCGTTYQITCHTMQQAESILNHLLQCDGLAIVSQNGGLLNHLSIRENLILPSIYHGSRSSLAELERDALELLSACGQLLPTQTMAQWMCASPSALNQLDKRLVAYVRALLSRPEVLVFDHVFEGLTRSEVDRVLKWRCVFHRHFPFRTLIFIDGDFNGLPELPNCVSVTARGHH